MSLRVELEEFDLAHHLVRFYQTMNGRSDNIAASLDHGLRTNRRCLYLADHPSESQIEKAPRTTDLDVDRRTEAGKLVIRDAPEVRLDTGFDPEQMTETGQQESRASVDPGYEGRRMAGENTGCVETEVPVEHILDFEADFDAVCPDLPVTALCQYDLTRFSDESTAKAFWTLKQFLYRNSICDNRFYIEPPRDGYAAAVRLIGHHG